MSIIGMSALRGIVIFELKAQRLAIAATCSVRSRTAAASSAARPD